MLDPEGAVGDLARRVQELGALYGFTEKLFHAKSRNDVYDAGLDTVLTALNCERASISLFDEAGTMRFVAWRGLSDAYRHAAEGHSPWAADDGAPTPVAIDDAADADFAEPLKSVILRERIGALAFIPLVAHGKLIGKFVTYHDRARRYGKEEIELALTIARQLGFAIERSRAEDAARGREAALESIIDQTPFMLIRVASDYTVLFASRAYSEMLALSSEDVIGKPLVDIIGTAAFDTVRPDLDRVLRGEPIQYERAIPYARVGTRILRGAFTPERDERGFVRGYFGSLVDVTERAQAEARLAALNEQLEAEVERRTRERDRVWNVSEDLLGVSNFDGYFISINPAWAKTLGFRDDEIKSLHVDALRHPEDAAHSKAGREKLARGVPTVRMENRFRHQDGSWRWIAWTMTAEDGLIYVAGRDVTVEKEAAEALKRVQRQLAEAQKMEALGQLTGGVAHDFNNLLMIVGGYAQMLKKHAADPRSARAIEAIQSAVSRGESLTRQLLSFSRRQPLNPVVVHPAEAVEAIRDVLLGSTHVNIALAIDIPQHTWPICVDRSEFALALVNIAINARDAMPAGGGLTISSVNVNLDGNGGPDGLSGDYIALKIADTGAGIPAEILPRVFEPFFTTKALEKGTGLGLSQVYGFARRSGGGVVIASELERGTAVTLYLPRSPVAPTQAAPSRPQQMGGRQETILIVEDNPDVRAVAVMLLEQLGYRTVAADSGPAALRMLGSDPRVDLVFTDVVLPGAFDGLALAQSLGALRPDLPVVLTTGYAKRLDGEPGFPVLRKPYDIAALARVVREAIDMRPSARDGGTPRQSAARSVPAPGSFRRA
jgi:PAS domain S-box-containing protein